MANLQVGVAGNGTVTVGAGASVHSPANNTLTLGTNGDERVRIDSSGKILAGATSSRTVAGGDAKVQVEATSSEGVSITRTSADNGAAYLSFGKTRSGSVCQAGDKIGAISWNPDDGTDLNHAAAEIQTVVASGIGGNDVPGDLVFSTNGGATSTTERVRIDKNGQLVLSNGSMSTAYGNSICGGTNLELDTSGIIKFRTDTNQKMSVTDNGLCFGTDTAAANALDDYEEGLHTVALTCSTSGTITLDGSYNTVAYHKIGNWVNVYGRVRVTSTSSPSGGQLRFSLPFQSASPGEDAGRVYGTATIQNADQNENNYGIGPTSQGNTYVQVHNINVNDTNAPDVCSQVNTNSLVAINVSYRSV